MPELRNSSAAWVDEFVPARTHPNPKRLRIRSTGSGSAKRIFIFVNRPFHWGQTLVTLKLHMYGVGTGWGTRTVWLERIAPPGFANGIAKVNWNNQPGVTGPTVGVTQTNPADGTEWVWDIKDMCQTISDQGSGWLGFRLTIDQDTPREFYGPKAVEFTPWLEYEVSDRPEQPTSLSPDDSAISIQQPTLRFAFTDYSGDEPMDALQVQIDAANNFVSGVDFDSGTVLTTAPQLDTTQATPGGTWAGLSVGASTFWRVRARAGGDWSDWSDPATFSRQSWAALNLTNPAASPNNFVTEWTPPITWTFAGTQTAYRILLDRVSSGTVADRRIHDSELQSGTALSHQIPREVLTEDGQQYRIEVRVHDQHQRENTPGDPAFISVSRTFTYQAGATTPVTSLAAAELVLFGERSPFVKLTWSRATAPDSFTIKRDGQIIDTDIDPSDVLVSGTNYEYIDRWARPNVSHTWKVAANVNGINSADADVVHAVLNMTGIWLYDPDKDLSVLISGTDPGSWEMPETAETVYPLNGLYGRRITASLHPFAGSFTGGQFVRSADGSMNGSDWEERFMRIKEHPGRRIYLNAADRAFPAIVFDMVPAITDSTDPTDKDVSFGFIQVGGATFKPRSA